MLAQGLFSDRMRVGLYPRCHVGRERKVRGCEPGSGKGPARMTSSITEQYLIEKVAIGSGVFGTVFRAKHKACVHPPTVAVKAMKIDTRKRALAFLNEVAAMDKLNHPNICRLVESYKAGWFLGLGVLSWRGAVSEDQFEWWDDRGDNCRHH
jgi:hypothetical protein